MYFVLFKRQADEVKDTFSVVPDDVLADIPTKLIKVKKQVEDKIYTKEELKKLVEEAGGIFYDTP